MSNELKDRTALITAAAGSLGTATSRRLAAAGARLFLTDVDAEGLARLAAELAQSGAEVRHAVADAVLAQDVQRVVQAAHEAWGRLDILVNIAGGAGGTTVRDIDQIDEATWDAVLDLNLKSSFLFSRAAVPFMRERGFGRIVNFSSTLAHGKKGPITTTGCRLAYATAKAALFGFTAQLAKDVAEHGITVNVLVPSLALGDPGTRSRDRHDAMPDEQRRAWMRDFPVGRPAHADEVAAAVLFLASDGAAYVTGATLPVDGASL
ncbi:MAG: SDR family oxidoreductase [Hydrogenophaga sp.]|nr:SDR family oxidoreductase [Hydrogenophaga sp.]